MQIERINLREKFDRARHGFDTQLAEVLLSRSDLCHAQIGKEFGGMREPGGFSPSGSVLASMVRRI